MRPRVANAPSDTIHSQVRPAQTHLHHIHSLPKCNPSACRDTPATIVLKPRMLGSLVRRSRGRAGQGQVSFCRRPMKGLAGRELRDRATKQGLLRHQAAASSAGLKRQTTQSPPLPVDADRVGPQRQDARGTVEVQPRGSKNFGSNPGEVLKAKSVH